MPTLRPGLAHGHARSTLVSNGLSDAITDGGVRAMLGGGVGVLFRRSGIGLDVGFQQTFVKGGKVLLGAGMSVRGR